MPRTGRRGRFWDRFQRETEHNYEEIPPPPPPPNIDRFRWSYSPTHHRASRRRTWHEGSPQDGASPPHWQGARIRYMEYEDEADGMGSGREHAEICFICGDLLSNHPEVPTIHLCDSGDYAIVDDDVPRPHSSVNVCHSVGAPEVPRRNHESRSPSQGRSRPASYVEGVATPASSVQSEATPSTSREDTAVGGLHQQLYDTQQSLETVNTQIQDLCQKLKCGINLQQATDGNNEEIKEEFAEKLVTELQDGLQEQYSQFVNRIKQHISHKSSNLDAQLIKLTSEKSNLEKLKQQLDNKQVELDKKEKEMAEMKKKLTTDADKNTKDCEKEREEISQQWQKLNDEVHKMEELNKIQQGRVKLDVGGHVFTTSTSTLIKDSESMLAAMFSGRHELKHEADGTVFIDRDGTHFRYILNYLRDGVTDGSLPDEQQILRELLNEAAYYQITGLVEAVEEKLKS